MSKTNPCGAEMSHRLPNLNQLRAFEAAARLESFKGAAEELNVTHAAISHQIKALEEDLGRPLFRRLTRRVELLPDAAVLSSQLTRSLEEIAAAALTLRKDSLSGSLRITAVPAFGYRFVLPRLPAFHQEHEGLEVQIDLQAQIVQLGHGGYDAALRYGAGKWPGLESRLIIRDELAPIAAPSLFRNVKLPLDPADIAALPYATSSPGADSDWQKWLSLHDFAEIPRPTPIRLENRAIVLDYVLSGSGVALIDLHFAAKDLEAGTLVRLHPDTIKGINGTYLVAPKLPVQDQKVRAFGNWLTAEAESLDLSFGQPWLV